MAAVVLAHEAPFRLGEMDVLPATRSVSANGHQEIVEPRVMQVLVALAKADGAVLSRDDLIVQCWEGRVVGDDAINRVLSRLRRLAKGIGGHGFLIETVTRVGYRLRLADGSKIEKSGARAISRRAMVGGTAAAIAAVGATMFVGLMPGPKSVRAPTHEIEELMRQAQLSLRQSTREGQNQAIALYRQVVALDPRYADGWGALGIAYGISSHYRASVESASLSALAEAAGNRAVSLQRDNALGQVALATSLPTLGNWHKVEQPLRQSIVEHPHNEALLLALATMLSAVGRNVGTLPLYDRIAEIAQPSPATYFAHIQALWRARRMEETDALIARASALYPTHFAIWFSKFYIAMFSGRIDAAVALGRDQSGRPTGIPRSEFDDLLAMAEALRSGETRVIDAVIETQRNRARRAAGQAENAIQFAAALGRIDVAIELLNAYYFGEPFEVPEVRFTVEQGSYTPKFDRLTPFLFNPPLKAVRADPRFNALVARLGLRRYWEQSGSLPDYLIQDDG
jgi:DNA-binding winged helix-turn-helix (wHTH) protein/tetratricopeptide (TPR) repeat protein